ncbi:ribbon-helix-helix domain-containing protein [Sphingobium sp. MK2]|uniref:ribbon-helix-helix domain-containing protein n=1 Tax=Sphingobium sp. MK2 TaxID=3116540 RepID=UPI0032E36364
MSITGARKPARGRPKIGATPVNVRLPPDDLAALDQWIAAQPEPRPTRPEAIRRVLAERLGQG